MKIKIELYDPQYQQIWDKFVENAKNSHFFFKRNYMEYHSDRFKDFSLLVFDNKDKLIALLPANIKDNILYSHQGLTFGGFIVNDRMKAEIMINIFSELKKFLKKESIKKLVYKCIPYIYHKMPAEEDRYALFIHNAKLIRRDITATIYLEKRIKYEERRKRMIKKAIKNNLQFEYSENYEQYWEMLTYVLEKFHNTKPVHSLEEIVKLRKLFPENIKLFVAKKNNSILAGTLIFENEIIAHTQYLANSEEGRKIGALDFVIDKLINEVYMDKKYFDFGISNENEGRYLNKGLIEWKEGFGARAIAHDFYELEID